MISNSSGTARCDQILKQMMYGGRKVREKREILRMEEGGMEKREKNMLLEIQGRHKQYFL